jgi:murein DD-endopeptidase MepM/ murein hydrolase activator NlpD
MPSQIPLRWFLVALGVIVGALVVSASPVLAYEPKVPGQKEVAYQRWWYPSQIPNGPLEEGDGPAQAAAGGFLTLPFTGPHYVTSVFDHCSPNYVPDGLVCRYDGSRKQAGGFDETGPPSQAWLYYDGHDGWDYGLYYEDVLASADGVVSYADWNQPGCATCGYGQEVRIDHGNGITTRYAHLSKLLVGKGQRVRRGQVIGVSGNTGASTGEHLHWGVYLTQGFIPIDPYGWSGTTPDPWPHDVGDLWLDGAPRFPAQALPAIGVSVKQGDGTEFVLDWKSMGAGSYSVQVVKDGGLAQPWLHGVTGTSVTFDADPGHAYAFIVDYSDQLGWTSTGISDSVAFASGLRS